MAERMHLEGRVAAIPATAVDRSPRVATGIYVMLSYLVVERTSEIGIRRPDSHATRRLSAQRSTADSERRNEARGDWNSNRSRSCIRSDKGDVLAVVDVGRIEASPWCVCSPSFLLHS